MTMNEGLARHLSDDDMVLRYYGEMTPAEEAAAAGHLAACAACRGEYTRLQRVLAVVDEGTVSTDTPPGFERTVWARLEPSLPRAATGWRTWLRLAPAPVMLAAAVAILVAVAFTAGRFSSPGRETTRPADAGVAADSLRERILMADVGEHLDRSQMVLVELVSTDAADLSFDRARAEQLVADTRLYRQTAEATGNGALGALLEEIERVLTEIAATPEDDGATALADVRGRIESQDLLFKVRVLSSAVRERQRDALQRRTVPRS